MVKCPLENIGFALQLKGLKEQHIHQQVESILKIVGLSHVAQANIWELSGWYETARGYCTCLD